ncbi:hypothetical protein [Pseudomonas fluorescens group sp. PF-69]
MRGIEWFDDPKVAVDRLCLLLKDPLVFSNTSPVWWWRNGDLQISSIRREAPDFLLMDGDELLVKRIAAVDAGAYWQQFVYVEVHPMEATGVYPERDISRRISTLGYASEEFALFKGKYISREEYDDGAAVIDGEVVALDGNAELRTRYLAPYNFIIAPVGSCINNQNFDTERVQMMDGMLNGSCTIEQIAERVRVLPKNRESI